MKLRFGCFSGTILRLVVSLLVLDVTCGARAQIRDGDIDPANLGKGDWIYAISDATNRLGGHVNSVTNENSLMLFYKSQGVRYLIVKAGTGASLFNACYGFPQFTTYLVNVAHANGLLILGYNRSYATNTAGEIAIANFVFNQGADGFVWDAESEWESAIIGSSGPSLAWAQCSAVRSNWPNKFLAHAPFPIINYHSSFPYKEFGYWCDAVMPQIYHSGWTNVYGTASGGINWSDVNWANWQRGLVGSSSVIDGVTIWWTNAIKPLIPVENVYGGGGSSPCEGTVGAQNYKDVMEFIDYLAADPNCVTKTGYNGVNFWRADLHGAVQWANIKASTSGNLPGQVINLVLDDRSAQTVGPWTVVRTFYNGTFYGNGSVTDTNSFGTNYLTRPKGTGSATVQFTPTVVVPGDYRVYQWHPNRVEASAAVPFTIAYSGGTSTITANQQTNAGNWSLLGQFNFLAGTSGTIRVSDAIPEAGGIVMVDGIKLVFVMPTSLPAAPSGLNASAASTTQISLTWTDNANNETGFVISRSLTSGGPYSDIGSVPSTLRSYSDGGLTPSTTYYYMVRATNYLGASANSAPTNATTLGFPSAPVITSQPQSQTNIAGQDATFSVIVSASPAPAYQWWFNNAVIVGATNSVYTRTNVQLPDAGTFQVVVTNSQGAVTSAPATLTVHFALNSSATAGGTVARNPDLPSYPPGSTVTLTALPSSGYAFLGWSGDASGTSNPIELNLSTNASVTASFVSTATDIVMDNTDASVRFAGDWQTGNTAAGRYGGDYRFALTADGGLSNATYRPYIYAPGYYNVYLWYPQGSNRATNAPWTISYQGGTTNLPVNQQVNGGSWYPVAASLPFARGTNGCVQLSNDTGYSGSVVLADAVRFLYVAPLPAAPTITKQPQNRAAVLGKPAMFSVAATGSGPLRYLWQLNGADLPAQTTAALDVPAVGVGDFGTYQALVSNDGGTVLSEPAMLSQALAPELVSSAYTAAAFILNVASENGPTYSLECKASLGDLEWLAVTNRVGNGGIIQLVDLAPTSPARFYRVHAQ